MNITVSECREVVGTYFRIRKETMVGPKKKIKIARPRQMAMTLAREIVVVNGRPISFPNIVKQFGRKDHTTAICAMKRIRFLEAERPAVRTEMDGFRLTLLTWKYQQDAAMI